MNDKQGRGGIGFWGLLGLLFIGLKLVGVIDWPWVWVTAPVWGPLVLALAVLGVCAFIEAASGSKR